MLRYGFEIYQQLIKMFVRTNKRFPNPQENKFLQNQALRVRESLTDRGVNMEELSAEDALKVFSQPPTKAKKPMAEIYKPLEFGKRERKREGIEALDEAKVFDQFRDENTLQNLYRTRKEALAKGDNKTALKISEDIFAIENKKPLSDFADGGRVGFESGGFASTKDFIESIGDAELMDIYIKVMDGTLPEDALAEALQRKGYKTYADGGRVEMASGGIAVLKSLLNFLAKGRGKKGSQLLQEVNPKKFGTTLENLMLPEDKKMIKGFRVEYLESLLDTIRTDKAMLDKMKTMPIDQREAFFNMINEGMNRGRLDVYKKIDPDEAILEIEQMIKNLKFKDVPEQEIKRQMNADGGRVGLMAGGVPKIKQMIDFILKHGDKVSKVGGKMSKEFLEFMAEKNPQNIKNVYLDVVKRLGMGIDVGKAPKTNLKKVRSRVEADKRITKELADEGQIEVNEDTASDMAEFMKREDPEGFKKIQKIVDDINQKKTAPRSLTSEEKLYDEYIYYRDELGNFEGSFDDFIVARRKAGSLYAEETPLSKEAVKRKQNADGGLATLFEEK